MKLFVRAPLPALLLVAWVCSGGAAGAQTADEIVAGTEQAILAAEGSLRAGELQIAESRYRTALFEGWMATGALHVAGGRLVEAVEAFERATRAVAAADPAFRSLALVQMQLGRADEAVTILTMLSARAPEDLEARRLLAQVLAANGRSGEAVQILEEAHAIAPDDDEITFLLAGGYLKVGKIDAAERLFEQVAAARPLPQTWVLIGRTYRDFRLFDRARAAFEKALALDPKTRRAHYYLGTLALMPNADAPLEEAIREFRLELKLAPEDAAVNLRLGMALTEARDEDAALPHLEIAARTAPSAIAFYYLGRCQLATGRAPEAVSSLRRALDLAAAEGEDESRVQRMHYQLAVALRRAGDESGAAAHFEAAKSASERQVHSERDRLARYMQDSPDPVPDAAAKAILGSPFAAVAPEVRAAAADRLKTALARAYVNLGVMRAQSKQFARASEFFEQASAVDPGFPRVHYFLGSARFNAGDYAKAAADLTQALAAERDNAEIRRMLALAHFNAGAYGEAADLLAADPQRDRDASLQYTYGLALVRSNRAGEAQAVFTRLLAEHADRAELHVILGQAHAQQGDFGAAVQALERARGIDPAVADANVTLGLIYLKQGKLAEAAAALREELRTSPRHVTARHLLATVLDLDGRPDDALTLLRGVLQDQPEFGDARYLLGKILLASGDADGAIPQLETAVRLSPEDASYHYQLAMAYRKAGRTELADKHVALFQALKDRARKETP